MAAHIELVVEVAVQQQKEILMALLTAAGATGMEEERNRLKVYFEQQDFDSTLCKNIIEQNGPSFDVRKGAF